MFEIGTYLILKDGKSKFISIRDNAHSVSIETANKLYETGQISMASVSENGDELFFPIEKYVQIRQKQTL